MAVVLSSGRKTVARLLRERHYSLRTNRKCLARKQDPDRRSAVSLLGSPAAALLSRKGWPVSSVDAKKREMVGNFKNPGRCWATGGPQECWTMISAKTPRA